jgi:2-oxoglutarate/2-oxoacid ferredoxin oxidoreductase subunit beta
MVELKEFNRSEISNWCPRCGNFAIVSGIKKALSELSLPPHQVVLTSGVGCFAKLPYWVKTNGFVGLHGRSLPLAQGVKLANPSLTVVAFGGDGDGYGEGGNHFIHACRRNVDVCYFVHNNSVFGLTTGQYSPTSKQGKISKSSPEGSLELPINPLALAISSGATFVARAYAGDIKNLVELMKKAIQHKGFAFIDIVQPCVTFGRDYDYYKNLVYYLDETHDKTSKISALGKSLEIDNSVKVACGIFYQKN